MTTVPCPRCGKPVGLDEEICPHCRAPRDDLELEEGRALARGEELRLKQRPRRIAAGVAGLIILCLAWFSRARITGSLTSAWGDFAAEVERTRDPRRYLSAETIIDASAGNSAAPAKLPAQVAVSSFVYLGGGGAPFMTAPAAEPANSNAASETFVLTPVALAETAETVPAPAPPGGSFRRFYGVIYDLDTLKPISGAKLKFSGTSAETGLTATANNQGHYQIDFFKGTDSELSVSAEVPGYRPGLFEDKDPPLLGRPHDARKSIMAELTEGDLEPIPLRFRESAELVELNLIVVPKTAR